MNTYFSSNKKLTGGALFASWVSKDGCVLWRLFPQIENDDKNRKNNFDWKNSIVVKLSQDEIGDIIHTIRNKSSCDFYHSFSNDGAKVVTTGNLVYYNKTLDSGKTIVGFGLTVKRGEREVKIGFTLGAAERFMLFHQHALSHIFNAEYSEDLRKSKEYQKKKDMDKPKPVQKEEPPTTNNDSQLENEETDIFD